ncbi:hypothetical protein [Marinobacterium sedimentorum]|nr:hypothetical protein [Marinobacterium sedimentorum]MCP8689345.1 hypothetical protein [Marinobacterium sedimentorum]
MDIKPIRTDADCKIALLHASHSYPLVILSAEQKAQLFRDLFRQSTHIKA